VKPPVLINTWHGTPIKKVGEEFRLFRAQQQHGGRLRDLANKISMAWFRLFPLKLLTNQGMMCFVDHSTTR